MWVEINDEDDQYRVTGRLHAAPDEGNHLERIDALRRVANAILPKGYVYQIRRSEAGQEVLYDFVTFKDPTRMINSDFPRYDALLDLFIEYEGEPVRPGS